MPEGDEPPSDAAIIAASLHDPHAFGEIYSRHHSAIYRYFARRLGTATAEELAAEVFVVAIRVRAKYDLKRPSALPWLYGIALNVLRNTLRAERSRMEAEGRLAVLLRATAPSGEEPNEAALLRSELAAVVGAMHPDDREILLLNLWEDLSYGQIAQVVGVPEGTVKSRLFRARAALRELSGALRQEPDEGSPRTRDET